MYKECRNVSGELICSIGEMSIDRMEEIEAICSKTEFSAREIFNALDADKDGIITKSDLEVLASDEYEKKYISKNDLKNLYSNMGKKICRGICNIMDNNSKNEFISIDDFIDTLDRDKDGKIRFGEFLKISGKNGDLLFITKEKFEEKFNGKWKENI